MSVKRLFEGKTTRRDALRALAVIGAAMLPFSNSFTKETMAAKVDTSNLTTALSLTDDNSEDCREEWEEIYSSSDAMMASGDFYMTSDYHPDSAWARDFTRDFLYNPDYFVWQMKGEMKRNDKFIIHYGEGLEQAKELATAFRKRGVPSLAMASDKKNDADIFYRGAYFNFPIDAYFLDHLLKQYC